MAKKNKTQISESNVLNCIVYAVIGILLITLKAGSLGILMTVAGVLLIACGLLDVLKQKDLIKGVIEIVLGVAIIVCGWLIADIVLLVFGIVLIIKGGIEFLKNIKSGLMANLSPLALIIIGALLVVARWAFADAMCVIAGVIFIINAVLVLLDKKLVK